MVTAVILPAGHITLENPRVSDDFNLYWRLFEKFSEYFLQDGEGNEHLFEKIWCYTTVAFSYENFSSDVPRNGTFLQFNWRYLFSYLHSLDVFS